MVCLRYACWAFQAARLGPFRVQVRGLASSRFSFAGGHPGPERGAGSGRGYSARMNPFKAVGTPRSEMRVKPRRIDPVSGCRGSKRKVRRAG